tara:strand:- start:557 stop:1132 length:576 start_codon:yes stop_codon:yes gene_type:complete
MGVNVTCTLPADVKVKDASEVMGILAGLPIKEEYIEGRNGQEGWYYVTVPGVEVTRTSSLAMVDILIKGDLIDGQSNHYYYWHFEGHNGTRSFGPKSTAFWIAVCKGLVDFFGGQLIYNDCSSSLCDYRKASRYSNSTDGFMYDHGDDLYYSMNQRKRNLKPLTLADLKAVHQYASYQTPEIFEVKETTHV